MTSRPEDVFVREPRYIGVVTPSGNTVVERVTSAIVGACPGVTALYSRTPVFGAADPFPDRYGLDDMLRAAELLSHAQPDVLLWNGSKGAKIGLEHDRHYARQVEAQTGIRCTTSILALDELLRRRGIRRIAIVTPYDDAYQAGLVAAYREAGYEVVAERHAERSDNLSFASIPAERIATMLREAATARPEAVLSLCTNFPTAPVVPFIEEETGVPMFDSVSIGVWAALRLAGIPTRPAAAWGRVFDEAAT